MTGPQRRPCRHQTHEIAQGSAACQNPSRPRGQADPVAEPAAEVMFKACQTRRKLLCQEVVIETCTDQFRRNGCGERGRIEMGQSTGMGRLIRPIHHLLKVTEQRFNASPLNPWGHVRQGAHDGDRAGSISGADPTAQQI